MIAKGARGFLVERIQTKLTELGLYHFSVDGIFGPQTEIAVRFVQAMHNIQGDGVVGPATWEVLFPGEPMGDEDRQESFASKFDRAVHFILSDKIEGGYVNDPDDPGGETKYGISKRSFPFVDIASLTKKDAIELYRSNYWERAGCDALPDDVALIHFDAAVNQGVSAAIKFLQNAIMQAFPGVRIEANGVLSPATMQAVKRLESLEDTNGFEFLYLLLRLQHYATIMQDKPDLRKYARGWLNRIMFLFDKVAPKN